MLSNLPANAGELAHWPWDRLAPYYADLAARELSAATAPAWLADWSHLSELVFEAYARLYVAMTQNTADEQAQRQYQQFAADILPPAQTAEQRLKQKLLDSGLQPAGMEIPLRDMRAEVEIFREQNLPLQVEERQLANEYQKVAGAQTVTWNGAETTLMQLLPVYEKAERPLREQAWRLTAERQLADRETLNGLWRQLRALRQQMARNAGFRDFRDYQWKALLRFDYTPDDCRRFHAAIEEVVVPAAARVYAAGQRRLGLDRLRPWDLQGPQGGAPVVDPPGTPPLEPFAGHEFLATAQQIFDHTDPVFGGYYRTMRAEGLLDVDNRKGKAPGGYCTTYYAVKRPFIFMNAVGIHDDVQTLLHESGHAFHAFESGRLPYLAQRGVGAEFSEVASMSMELLAAPYLAADRGGFYAPADAARARAGHLRSLLAFWPYMAVVDAFQHWAYMHEEAQEPGACDAEWDRLWQRFMPGVDWSGLEDARATGWQRKLHIFLHPFYYVEYGLAQLGAVQVWRNALADQAGAVAAYRRGLALGGTRPLPELFAAAGARFAFDAPTLRTAVELVERQIAELE